MNSSTSDDAAVDTLILALAVQAGQTSDGQLSDATLACLADVGRETTRTLLSSIGHLAHYGSGLDTSDSERWLRALYEQLIAALRRRAIPGEQGLLPGDIVKVIEVRPGDHFTAEEPMIVWFVGDDGTVDIGFASLFEDYVGSTVQATNLRRVSGGAT